MDLSKVKTAVYIVHWPGKASPACEDHAEKLARLAAHMGFTVSATPWVDDDTPCVNCVNEALKAEQ